MKDASYRHPPTYYFYASIEGDVLICAGLSAICKALRPGCATVLLLPDHPRVKNKKLAALAQFDRVVPIPYVYSGMNVIRGIQECLHAKKILHNLALDEERVCFLFDLYDVVDILVYSRMRRQQNETGPRIFRISAFDIDFGNSTNLQLALKRTLVESFYSMLFTGKLLREYRVPGTESAGIRRYEAQWDATMTIMRGDSSSGIGHSSLQNLPYPPIMFIDEPRRAGSMTAVLPKKKFILVLLDSLIPKNFTLDPVRFWTLAEELLAHLVRLNAGAVYVKGHPGFFDDIEERITNKEVHFLHKELHAEDIYIQARSRIKAVFGVVSTGMITASWMGLPVYDCADYFGIGGEWSERSRRFLALAQSIVRFKNLSDIDLSESSSTQTIRRFSKDQSLAAWKSALRTAGAMGAEA